MKTLKKSQTLAQESVSIQDIQTWLCVTIAHYMASSRSRQDEPNPELWLALSWLINTQPFFDLTLGQSIMHMLSFWNCFSFSLWLCMHLEAHCPMDRGSPWCVSRFSFPVKKNNSTYCVLYIMHLCHNCYNTNPNIKTTRNIFANFQPKYFSRYFSSELLFIFELLDGRQTVTSLFSSFQHECFPVWCSQFNSDTYAMYIYL